MERLLLVALFVLGKKQNYHLNDFSNYCNLRKNVLTFFKKTNTKTRIRSVFFSACSWLALVLMSGNSWKTFFNDLFTGVNSEDYELCGGDVASADFPADEVQCSISIGLPCKSSGTIRTFGYPELIASPNLGEVTKNGSWRGRSKSQGLILWVAVHLRSSGLSRWSVDHPSGRHRISAQRSAKLSGIPRWKSFKLEQRHISHPQTCDETA